MKVAILLDKLNFNSELTKIETEALIYHLSSISELELFIHPGIKKNDLVILRKIMNKKNKMNFISIPVLVRLFLDFDFIFTASNKNLVTSIFSFLPKKNYIIYIQAPKICEIDTHLLKKNKFDIVLNINDMCSNLQLLEKIMRDKLKNSNTKKKVQYS